METNEWTCERTNEQHENNYFFSLIRIWFQKFKYPSIIKKNLSPYDWILLPETTNLIQPNPIAEEAIFNKMWTYRIKSAKKICKTPKNLYGWSPYLRPFFKDNICQKLGKIVEKRWKTGKRENVRKNGNSRFFREMGCLPIVMYFVLQPTGAVEFLLFKQQPFTRWTP